MSINPQSNYLKASILTILIGNLAEEMMIGGIATNALKIFEEDQVKGI